MNELTVLLAEEAITKAIRLLAMRLLAHALQDEDPITPLDEVSKTTAVFALASELALILVEKEGKQHDGSNTELP